MWKKIKAALFTGTFWAAAWAAWSTTLVFVMRIFGPPTVPGLWEVAAIAAIEGAVAGFFGGLAFAGVVGVLHRQSTLEQLSPWRLGLAGIFAGMFVPGLALLAMASISGVPLTVDVLSWFTLLFGVPSAASAYWMIKVAKAAPALPSPAAELLSESAAGELAR